MKEHRNSMVLYTTAVCNLNCRYCFIDKNPSLQKIDTLLDKSYNEDKDYYFNFAKEMFFKDNLTNIQIWGGEPSLNYMRAFYTFQKCIEYFPNFKEVFTSTNLTGPNFFEQFFSFIEVFRTDPLRNFTFNLQLSLDGPTEINDQNRGEGVTQKITNNFFKLIQELQEKDLPPNLKINLHFKQTLDSSSIRLLQTKESIIAYYKFFEQYYDFFNEYNKKEQIYLVTGGIPNTACPSPHTKEDGLLFANLCKLCYEIEQENKYNNILPWQPALMPFRGCNKVSYVKTLSGVCLGHCGSGRSVIGLLPNDMISCCHNGFVDLISEYKKNALAGNSSHMNDVTIEKSLFTNTKASLIFKKNSKEFDYYEQQVEEYYYKSSTVKISTYASMIHLLALTDQVDSKYKDLEEATKAAQFIMWSTAYCVRDNLNTTGSIYLPPLGLLKLTLNGAREWIEKGVKKA